MRAEHYWVFPDPSWQKRSTIGAGITTFLGVLGWYWVFGWLLLSGVSQPDYPLPDYAWFCLCISLCILGCVNIIAADAQKYFTLRHRRVLITDGMFRYIRHPNYLGEMILYGSFAALMVCSTGCRSSCWPGSGAGCSPRSNAMRLKEASLSRYPRSGRSTSSSSW